MTYAGLHNLAVSTAGSYSCWVPMLPGNKKALEAQEVQIKSWEERFTKKAVDQVVTPDIRKKIWSPGDPAKYEQLILQNQIISGWADTYGEEMIHGIVTPELRNRIWGPEERTKLFCRIYGLHQKMEQLKVDFDAESVASVLPPSDLGKLTTKVQFDQKRLQIFLIHLQKTLKPAAYQYLTEFLDLNGPDAAERLGELYSKHDQFVQTADLKLTSKETATAKRDCSLWERFKTAAFPIPFMGRVGMAMQLDAKLQQAKSFWSQVDQEMGKAYPAEEIQTVAKTYFSRFSQGHVPVQKENLEEMKLVLERRKVGKEIADNCLPLLQLKSMESAHSPLEGKEVLQKAMEAQIAFDTHLQKLRRLDLYFFHRENALAEKTFYKNLEKIPEKQLKPFLETLSETDKQIVASLEKRAKASKTTLQQAIATMLGSLESYIEKMDENIQSLEEEFAHALANRIQSCDSDLIDPNHFQIKSLLLMSRFLKDHNPQPIHDLLEEIQSSLQALQPGQPQFLVRALYLARVQKELLAFLKPTKPESAEASFFQKFYVFPLGDVLYNSGKWAVLDLREVPAKDRKAIAALFNKARLEADLNGKQPYQAVSYQFQKGQLVPEPKGAIKLFYEKPDIVIGAQENRDFGQRNRLSQKTWMERLQEMLPGNQSDHTDYGRVMKDPRESQNLGHWNPGREMTASVDRLQAIWTSRLIFNEILSGRAVQINSNTYQHVSEYFDALQGSDIAKMERSYTQDPAFNQAVNFFGKIAQSLIVLAKERISVVYQEKDAAKRKYNLAEGIKLLAEIQIMYQTWTESIRTFLAACEKDPQLKSDLSWFEAEFKKILPFLETFKDSLPKELREMSFLSFEQINANYAPEYIEAVIRGSIKGLQERFKALQLPLNNLSIVFASKTLLKQLTEKLQRQEFAVQEAAQTTVSKAFQTPARTETCLTNLAEAIAEPSPLHLQIKEAAEYTKQEVIEASRLRSRVAKGLLNRHGQKNAIQAYFPKKTSAAAR